MDKQMKSAFLLESFIILWELIRSFWNCDNKWLVEYTVFLRVYRTKWYIFTNVTQGQFLAEFNRFEFRVFLLNQLPYLG